MPLHRLQFDVTDETLKEIDELQKTTGFPTRAELIRNALRFLQWVIQEMDNGADLLIEKEGKRERITFPFLRRAKPAASSFGIGRSGAAD